MLGFRTALSSTGVAALLLATPVVVSAQEDIYDDAIAPIITVSPQAGTYASSTHTITVGWCDNSYLNANSRAINLNGTDVTHSFTFEPQGATPLCARRYTSTGTVTLSAGPNEFSAEICDHYSNCSFEPVTYTLPSDRIAPQVSTAPHNGEYRDTGKCAVECFALTLGYTTPAYFSADRPQSAALFYSSAQAAPQGFVQVDATDNSAHPATKMSIQVINPWGWAVTPEIFYAAGSGTQRLAAQWDAGSYGTSALVHTVRVRSYWEDGGFQETTAPVRVIIVNERGSPYGAGWSIAGLQRLATTDGGVVISEGDGSAGYFALSRCWNDPLNGQVCEYTSPSGDFTTLHHWQRWGEYRRRYPDRSEVVFSASGYMTNASDSEVGNRYHYDGAGRVSAIEGPSGALLSFAYDGAGKLASITDPAGRVSRFIVNGAGDLTDVLDPANGYALRLSYTPEHRVSRWLDRGGNEWLPGYDAYGRLAQVTGPAVEADGTVLRPTARFKAPENGVLAAPGYGGMYSPTPRVSGNGVRAEVTTPRGVTTRMAVDRFGAPTIIEAPLGQTTQLVRGRHSQVLRSISPTADTVDYEYDPTGLNPTRIVDRRTGTTIEMGYTSDRRLLWARGGLQDVQNVYDESPHLPDVPQQLMYSKVGSEAYFFEYTMGHSGRLGRVYGPGGDRGYHFATAGLLNTDSVSESDGNRVRYRYDQAGRIVAVRNTVGDSVRYEYDALNRVTRTINGAGHATAYTYGPLHLSAITDAAGKVHQFSTNALGWRTAEVDPQGRTTNYWYDSDGNVTATRNHRGQTVSFGYDTLGRPIWREADGARTTFGYAADGSWVAASNAESADTVRVQRMGGWGWEVDQVAVRGPTRHSFVTAYDAKGVRTGANGYWLTYQDADGSYRPTGIWEPSFRLTSLGYDQARARQLTVLPSGDTIFYDRTAVRYSRAALDQLVGVLYSRDDLGRETQRARTDSSSMRLARYDGRGQLAAVQNALRFWSGWEYIWSFGEEIWFLYDAVQNRVESGTLEPGSNRLATWKGYSFTYDAEGNLVSKAGNGETFSYGWNSLGELTSVTRNGATTTYGYDGWGRRVRKTTGGVTTRFVYDGDHLVAEVDAHGNSIATYTYYPGVDRPHSVTRGGNTYYYLTDAQGNVLGLLDVAGNLVNQYRYTPWGEPEHVQEAIPNPLRFAAREFDGESGMYYFRARYYDASTGRFISEDPIGLAGGINTYAYAGNDPLNRRDPSGLDWQCGYIRWPVDPEAPHVPTVVVGPNQRLTGLGAGWATYCNWVDYEIDYPVMYGNRIITSGYAPGEYDEYLMRVREQEQDAYREELKISALQSARSAADLAVGLTPGLSTLHDLSVVVTGRNYITGEKVGALGWTIALVAVATPISAGMMRSGGKFIKRFGTAWEPASKLGDEAAAAARNGFPHGVSFTSHVDSFREGSVVSVEVLENAGFAVQRTGRRRGHYTVHLPQPVTEEVADTFNRLLGRTPP